MIAEERDYKRVNNTSRANSVKNANSLLPYSSRILYFLVLYKLSETKQ